MGIIRLFLLILRIFWLLSINQGCWEERKDMHYLIIKGNLMEEKMELISIFHFQLTLFKILLAQLKCHGV
jgi:hypothetical protein